LSKHVPIGPSDSFEPAIEAKAFIDGELSVKNVFLLIFFAIKMTSDRSFYYYPPKIKEYSEKLKLLLT
jgi:hypothetical protein